MPTYVKLTEAEIDDILSNLYHRSPHAPSEEEALRKALTTLKMQHKDVMALLKAAGATPLTPPEHKPNK